MPRISSVGSGYASADYATRALWWAAESGVDYAGQEIIAEMLGDCGDDYTISGSSINGARCYTKGVTFDGTNENNLAVTSRCIISVTNSFIESDIKYLSEHVSFVSFTLQSDNYNAERIAFENATTGTGCISVNGYYPNSTVKNFVAHGGDKVLTGGYNRGANFENGIIYNGVSSGVGSNRVQMVLKNIFAFNNGVDFVSGTTRIDCASEDLTGDYPGYTSAELVGFASGDLRTKSNSDLATLGTPFIGAFLEAGGSTIEVTGNTASFDYSAVPASIDLTGSIEVTGSTANFDYSAITGSIDLTGAISITGQTANFDYNSVNGLIDSTGELSVTGKTANFNYIAKPADIDLTGEITVTGATSNFDHTGVNGLIELGAVINVVGQTANFDINGVDAEVSLTGEIMVTGQTAIFNYIVMSGSVIIGTGQKIGKIMAGFADSGISVQYKQSTITVKFGE